MRSEIKRYVVCLKYGNKYSSEYVNKLYNMVQRHLSLDHEFYCITENSIGLDSNIKIVELKLNPQIANGWWYKISVFDPKFPLKGTILFLDLDLIIFNNMDKFFEYENGEFCIIEKFMQHNKAGVNSSCFRFESGMHTDLYSLFTNNSEMQMKTHAGDQDLIGLNIKNIKYWPKNWCSSYKLDMVTNIHRLGNYYIVSDPPKVYPESSIAVFHGLPNPHQIKNEWCETHWR
jgi:alpha-N-acetylglucosamine transferase